MAENRAATIAHRLETDEEETETFLDRQREKHPWLDHLVRAGERYTENHGDHYAAAITYFSILALVPLLMVAFALAAFVLRGNPDLLDQLKGGITSAVPGDLGKTLEQVVDQAIQQAGAIGVVGLFGALYSGIGWMSNLREALTEQWGQRDDAPAMIKRLAFDLLALLGLGLALVLSFVISSIGGTAGRFLLDLVGLGDEIWARVMLSIASFLLVLAGNWLVFLWVIARLPREPVSLRSAVKAALIGAVGFAILQRVMVFYLGSVTGSPAGTAFGPILGLLVFIFFTSRFLLFVTAWAASAEENDQGSRDLPAPAIIRPQYVVRDGASPARLVSLFFAGVVGGAAYWRILQRKRR